MNDFYIILTACLVAINCAIMGSFLVMRKMVMIGDAISHAVLPGIFFAYIFSGSTSSLPILIGAASSGILATIISVPLLIGTINGANYVIDNFTSWNIELTLAPILFLWLTLLSGIISVLGSYRAVSGVMK